MFLAANAGKRSLALDLQGRRADASVLLRLADGADVVRPEPAARRTRSGGFGPAALRSRNARLVYCYDRRLRQRRPAARPARLRPADAGGGRDHQRDGRAGPPGCARRRLARSTRRRGVGGARDPRRALERERTGEGRVVDVSLVRDGARLHRLPPRGLSRLGRGARPARDGVPAHRALPRSSPRATARCMIARGSNDELYRELCGALERPERTDDPRFATNPLRVAQPATSSTRSSPERLADASRLRSGSSGSTRPACRPRPCRTSPRWRSDPQTRALGSSRRSQHSSSPGRTIVALPLSVDGERVRTARPRRSSGSTRPRCSRELGYSDDEIGRANGVGVVTVG